MENSLRFEISLWSNWPKWNLRWSKLLFAWTHLNGNNEATLHRSEILPSDFSPIGLILFQVSWKHAPCKNNMNLPIFFFLPCIWLPSQTCQLSRIWRETHAFYKSYRESYTKLKISRIFHKKITMSLKIAKFINKHLKLYIQEYNYLLKVPRCLSQEHSQTLSYLWYPDLKTQSWI